MANLIMPLHIWIINKHVFTITPMWGGNSTVNTRAKNNAFSLKSQASLIYNCCASDTARFVECQIRAFFRLSLLWLLMFRFLIVVYAMYHVPKLTVYEIRQSCKLCNRTKRFERSTIVLFTLNFTTINY